MVRINLLPVRVSKKREAGKQQLVLFAAVLVLGIVGNVWYASGKHSALGKKQDDLAEKKKQVERLDKIIGEVTSLKTQQQQLEEKLKTVDTLKEGRTGPVKMLDELASITPRKLWIRDLKETAGAVTFEGTAATNFEVSQFMEKLEASQYFEGVELKKSEATAKDKIRVVDFQLSARVNYAPGSTAAQADKAEPGPKGPKGAKPAPAKAGG